MRSRRFARRAEWPARADEGGVFGGGGFGGGFGGGGFGGGRIWRRRTRQLPRLQSRPAARRHLLDRQQLGAERGAVCAARPDAGAAGLGHKPLRHHLHERALPAASDQAQRQGHDVPHALRHAQLPSVWTSMRPCPRRPSGTGNIPGLWRQSLRSHKPMRSDLSDYLTRMHLALPYFP